MYFKIERNGKCNSELEYGYFTTFEEIEDSSIPSYSIPYKSTSTSSVNGRVTSSTLYFTIKKDSKEYNGSNGNIAVFCYCRRKRLGMRQAYINQTPMMMYEAPQPMYPQQGNMVYMYGGQQVMAQPNGVPYNNPNMKYSNIPNNTPSSGLASQNITVPQHNNYMIPQSSEERGYNSNAVNEKVMK